VTATQIPDKFHFKIGEVSRILGVKPYVLRFWETNSGSLPRRIDPSTGCTSARRWKPLLEIKQLLYEERFTIEGAA